MSALQRGDDGSGRSTTIKIVVIVVALGAALFFAVRGGSDEAQPDTPESSVLYMCEQCGHVFGVTPADFSRLGKEDGVAAPAPDGSGPPVVMLRCPDCGEIKAVRASKCPNDGTPFPRRHSDRSPGRCPKCGYAFYAR